MAHSYSFNIAYSDWALSLGCTVTIKMHTLMTGRRQTLRLLCDYILVNISLSKDYLCSTIDSRSRYYIMRPLSR